MGIKINDTPINNLIYADDTVVIAETLEDLQTLINRVVVCSEEYGLSINTCKIKVMVASKSPQNCPDNRTWCVRVCENITSWELLSSKIMNSSEEIRIRIEKADEI